MSFDQKMSKRLYDATKSSKMWRPIAMFCAADLIWIILTIVAVELPSVDADISLWQRVARAAWFPGLPCMVAWGVCAVLQRIVKRKRPFDEGQGGPLINMVWTGPSFPSSHAAIVFSAIAAAFWLDGENIFFLLLLPAFAVSIARVAVGVHYMLDVVFGAMLGLVIGSALPLGFLWLAFLSH